MPLALSSIAGPIRISAVISALLQNEGRKRDDRAPVIAEPTQSAAAIIQSTSIHKLGHSDRPNQRPTATTAPISVDPTSSLPAERASVSPACWLSVTVFMIAAR